MSTSQPKTNTAHKQRDFKFWVSRFVILIGLCVLGYYGYCFGLWGRNSLLLQYIFQCNCPAFSEEWRYPKEVDVIVPACSYIGSILSSTGNLLYVMERDSKFSSTYLLDLQSNEKIPFAIVPGSNYFLTDDLLFLSLQSGSKGRDYILDRPTGKEFPIQSFIALRKDAYENGEPNLQVLVSELRDANDVYLIANNTIVALKSDFQTSPEHNFYFDQDYLPGHHQNSGEEFLQENGIKYHSVPDRFQEQALSPDGRFIARADGIYLAGSDLKIVEAYPEKGLLRSYYGKYFSLPRGWTSDSGGVIYSKSLNSCLLELPSYDGETCSISVPQPLLKLKVPEEYLSSTPMP